MRWLLKAATEKALLFRVSELKTTNLSTKKSWLGDFPSQTFFRRERGH